MKSTKLWLFYAIITTVFWGIWGAFIEIPEKAGFPARSEEHTSELQSPCNLVCRLLLEKKTTFLLTCLLTHLFTLLTHVTIATFPPAYTAATAGLTELPANLRVDLGHAFYSVHV